jgi:uncharacterized protein
MNHIRPMTETEIAASSYDDYALIPIDPRYVPVTRIANAIMMVLPVIGASVLEFTLSPIPGLFLIPILLIAVYVIFRVPGRKYRQWGYHMGTDRLRIVSGYLFHSDTIVPFGRIQHIDVEQGPLQRPYGLATLTVHTAGNHNSSVSLPCIAHDDALAMREAIRTHIKRDVI